MEEFFNQLKQTFNYLLTKQEILGMQINAGESFREQHQMDLFDATIKRLSDEDRAHKINSYAQALHDEINKILREITSVIKAANEKENSTWAGYIWNQLGYCPQSIVKLQKHLDSIQALTQNENFTNIEKFKQLLTISPNTRFIFMKLIKEAKEDLKQTKKDLDAQTTAPLRPANSASAQLAAQLNAGLNR